MLPKCHCMLKAKNLSFIFLEEAFSNSCESFISDCVQYLCSVLCVHAHDFFWARWFTIWKYMHILIHLIIYKLSDIMYLYFSWLSDDPYSGLIDISLINRLVQEVCLLRRLPGKQHPVFQAVPKPANTVMHGSDCRDCRQYHEPALGLQQVLFSWPPLWPCDHKSIEKYNLVIMNLLRNTTGIWLQSTSARSWCWNSI